jgi:ribonuclease D
VRPLTAEQVDYARADVDDVLALADELQERLARSGRLEWALEECRRLEGLTDERDPETVYRRLPRVNQLRPRPRAVAREVAAWRERTAAAEDRPVGQVLADMALVEIAKRQPGHAKEIGAIRGVRPDVVRRRGDDIVAAVKRGQEAPPLPPDEARSPPPDPEDAPLVALSEAVVRARTLEAGLAYELVASRADLGEIVAAARRRRPEPDVRTLQGWRRDLVGAELLELLAGRLSLAVDGGGGLAIRKGV